MKHLIIVKFKENIWNREGCGEQGDACGHQEDLQSDEADRRRSYGEHFMKM